MTAGPSFRRCKPPNPRPDPRRRPHAIRVHQPRLHGGRAKVRATVLNQPEASPPRTQRGGARSIRAPQRLSSDPETRPGRLSITLHFGDAAALPRTGIGTDASQVEEGAPSSDTRGEKTAPIASLALPPNAVQGGNLSLGRESQCPESVQSGDPARGYRVVPEVTGGSVNDFNPRSTQAQNNPLGGSSPEPSGSSSFAGLPGTQTMQGRRTRRRKRAGYLTEDERTWLSEQTANPPVIT
jgi:hypothetical protein